MNRVSTAAAFTVALIQSTYALRMAGDDNQDEDLGFTDLKFEDDQGLVDLEDLNDNGEEESGAIYYDPIDEVIYEILTDEEEAERVAAEDKTKATAASKKADKTQETISANTAEYSAADLVRMGILSDITDQSTPSSVGSLGSLSSFDPTDYGMPAGVQLISGVAPGSNSGYSGVQE